MTVEKEEIDNLKDLQIYVGRFIIRQLYSNENYRENFPALNCVFYLYDESENSTFYQEYQSNEEILNIGDVKICHIYLLYNEIGKKILLSNKFQNLQAQFSQLKVGDSQKDIKYESEEKVEDTLKAKQSIIVKKKKVKGLLK
ncbi:hypothetical protein PPERSA_10195 [Pseudocohnilembus persalinus]|uniref:Uncharacterized protein n=1 Tax=Pseudocohnilembus persalinus TaxID=266149 RepID=A0A0V0QLQ7_PSEPJ|nr:hypothetical protein PPERSA_10195 [Pseudocohnilembus persalinus]|eukprot:KRX03114.1 hypothetical protein PPERSA_10195 [Pseudocohnilembus persalinus]